MADKAQKFIQKGKENIKKQDYAEALSDLEVALSFQSNNSAIYLMMSGCYARMNQLDQMYNCIQKGMEMCADQEKFLEPLQKYYEKMEMLGENTDILAKICAKILKEDVSKLDLQMKKFVKSQLDWISSNRFIEMNNPKQIIEEKARAYSIIIDSLATNKLSNETLEQIIFLYCRIIINIANQQKHIEDVILELKKIVSLYPKTLCGYVLEESIFQLVNFLLHQNAIKEKNIVIFEIFSHFTNSTLSLFYQLKFYSTNQSQMKKQQVLFLQNVYETLCYLYYPELTTPDFNEENSSYKVFVGEKIPKQNQMSSNFQFDCTYDVEDKKSICQEFRIRAEIFLLYAYKFFNSIDLNKNTLANISQFEKRIEFYLAEYDNQSINASVTDQVDDSIYCNPLFEAYILSNYKTSKSKNKQALLFQFKKTIDRLEQQQENTDHLKEIYNKWGLKIIDGQDELVQIKNNLKYQIQVKSDDLSNQKMYYEYQLKLNKLFRIFDGSINLQELIDKVLKREPDNIFFKGEKLWTLFSNSANKKEFYTNNLAELKNLKESAVLQNEKDVAALIQKRIAILEILFGSSSSETIISLLEEALSLDASDYQIYVCLALTLFSQNRIKEALVQFQTAFLYRQHDIFLNKMLFFCLYKLDMKVEAIDFLYRIYPAFKQIFWINRILGVYFSNIGDYKKATSYCQKALELYQFDKERKYRLYYEKVTQLVEEKCFDIPHMMDYEGSVYFDDYLVWSDSIYIQEAVNLSNNLIIDPKYRLHIKLCISLAQADKMQGKTCSSLSAIEEAEKVYIQASNVETIAKKQDIKVDEDGSSLKSSLAKDVFDCLQIFSNVFLVSMHGDTLLREYNLNDDVKHIVDALTINFEYAQITSYLNDTHKTYSRIRLFIVICYQILEKIHGQQDFKNYEDIIFNMYQQMTGFILEISLNFVHFHWKKYTLSSARYLIDKLLQIKPPKKRSTLVNIAFSEFYTVSGFINNKQSDLNKSIDYLKEIFSTLSISFDSDIVDDLNLDKINLLYGSNADLFKYALKNICLSYFYLYKIDSQNNSAYQTALKICTAGILIFNLDIDFYNYYGLIEQNEQIKIGAFVKSNRIQKNSLALDNLAFIYLKKERYEEAANMLIKSIEIDTNNPTAYIGLFIIQYNMALAFNSVVQTGNDDNKNTYFNLQNQMIEKCGSYLHYVKQIEISASSVLFDSLLEYLQYHNERSHVSYQFSTDLFDRAPYLSDTQLGQLYKMMILKQSSTREKKLEIFSQIRNKISPENMKKLFIDQSAELNTNFLGVVERTIEEEVKQVITSVNECEDSHSQQFVVICRQFEYLIKNFKLYLSLAIYTNEQERGLKFFRAQTGDIAEKTDKQNLSHLCQGSANFSNLYPIYIQITELEYQIVSKIKPEEIDLVIKRLTNLKSNQKDENGVNEWPYSQEFTSQINLVSEYKYLNAVHNYKIKEYYLSKKLFFQAVLLDPAYKEYRGPYYEYLITQERLPIINPYNENNVFEQNLIVNLNNPNYSLKKKISQVTKAAMYLDKPYLYYLLVHYQFEESSNYCSSRLIKLLTLLKTKVLNDRYDPEGVFKKKGIKLFMEIYLAVEKLSSNDKQIQSLLSEYKNFITEQCSSNKKYADYKDILQIFYKDNNTNDFIKDLRNLFQKDRVSAYILSFNIIRKLIKEQKTNGMIQLLSSLSECVINSVQNGLIPIEVQKSSKGNILKNMLQHLDGYQYILSLQEDYREDSLYEKADIQEMIYNSATYCNESYPNSISMKFLYIQYLFRQGNMAELKKLLAYMQVTQFSCKNDDLITIFYYTLYSYYNSYKNPTEDNIYQFVEYITIIQDQYKFLLSSDLNTLLHFLQGIIYLKISEKRPDLDKKTIIKEFKQAILYSPEFAKPILKFLNQ